MKRIRPKRRSKTDTAHEGSWAISYGDMITLLLGFFIMFFSIDQEEIQEKLLQRSILATLSAKPLVDKANERFDQDIQEENFEYLGVEVKAMGKKVVVEFPETSFFHTNQTKLTSKGLKKLVDFAKKFVPFAGKSIVNVVGYTDDRPVKSPSWQFRDNLELSVLRAVSAQRTLQQAGIPIDRTRIGGYGVKEMLRKHEGDVSPEITKKRAIARTIVLVIEPENVL